MLVFFFTNKHKNTECENSAEAEDILMNKRKVKSVINNEGRYDVTLSQLFMRSYFNCSVLYFFK